MSRAAAADPLGASGPPPVSPVEGSAAPGAAPPRSKGWRWLRVPPAAPGWAAAGLLLIWYVATMARGLMWFDSGEFALVARQLGLAHPPGQPLYTLLGALVERVPGLPPLLGLNLLSAAAGAACALPADSLLRRCTALRAPARLLVLLAVGALAPVWDQATRIELYSLATMLSLALLAGGARAHAQGRADALTWLGLGALAGLLAAVNPVFAVAAAVAVGGLSAPSLLRAGVRASSRATAAAVGGGLLGLGVPYLYVLAVREHSQRFVWGTWSTSAGVWAYLSGADYGFSPDRAQGAWSKVPAHFGLWAGWLLEQGALPVVVLGLSGWLLGAESRRRLALLAVPLGVGWAFSLSYGWYQPAVPDYNGYLAPALWLGAVGLGVLLTKLRPRAAVAVAAALLALTVFTGARPLWRRSRAGVQMPAQLAGQWLRSAPEDAFVIIASDHLVFPLLYLQEVARQRLDLVIINEGFASSQWYWEHLYRLHPELPRIDLRAPSREIRLRRLVRATPGRAVLVELPQQAHTLGRRACPATWGLVAAPDCASVVDDPAIFQRSMDAWWQGPEGHDLITPGVLAHLARTRAQALWEQADARGALHALLAGVPPPRRASLPALSAQPSGPLPAFPPAWGSGRPLIGSARANLIQGAALLRVLGDRAAADRWLMAAVQAED